MITSSNIKGILQLTNNNKPIILKLEDILGLSSIASLTIKLDVGGSSESSVNLRKSLRINGQKIPNNESIYNIIVAEYVNTKSAILSISLDDAFIFDKNYYKRILTIEYISSDPNIESATYIIPIYITKNILSKYKIYDKLAQMIASNMESFMLLRTNPKLTGNVKLVVSEDYNLYLDTFKISNNSILNKQEYRHLAISSEGNYPYDVYRVFKFLPATEMYGIYPDSYDPHISYHKMDDLIRNIYEYGAEYNNDKLYSENMKILAPLYIGKHLPTYFAIWRSDRLVTNDNTVTNNLVFKQLLNDAKCIKIFDLRRSTSIGKYLNNYQESILKYLAGSCALLFIELDNDKNSIDHRLGQNTWKGLAYDKGILTDRNETTYFATLTLEGEHPQENYDMFLLNGYSRNNLLFPNIINLEFMFNDEDAKDFSMHNYFGLYLTENDFITFNEVLKKDINDNYHLNYYDSNDKLIKLGTTPINVIYDKKYLDRIFFASTKYAVTNLNGMKDLNLFVKNEVVNKPYKNIVQISGKEFEFLNDEKAFLTFDFTKLIHYGEHFKIIIPKYEIAKNNYLHVVFEIIASNDSRLKTTQNYISPYVQTNTTRHPIDVSIDDNTKIYTVAFYSLDLLDETIPASLSELISRIAAAISKFDNVIKVSDYSDESMALISSVNDVYLLHIMSDEFIENRDSSTGINLNDIEVYDTLRYYNYNNVQKCEYIEYNLDIYNIIHALYANNGLEETLERYANIVKFVNLSDIKNEFVYEIDKDIYEETNTVAYPLVYTVSGYFPLVHFNSNNGDLIFKDYEHCSDFLLNGIDWISIISPFNVKKSIICSPYEVLYINENINICSPMALNIALMGINSIKDIDVYINNEINELHSTSVTAYFSKGEYVKLDNSDSRIRKFITYSIISGSIKGIPTGSLSSFTIVNDKIIYTDVDKKTIEEFDLVNDLLEFAEDTTIMLVSTSSLDIYNYYTYYPVLNEDNFYIDSNNKEKSNLMFPLVPLINCLWKSNGCYFDTQSVLNTNDIVNNYETVGNFIDCVYTPGVNNLYIIDSLTDNIHIGNELMSIYEYMLKTGSIKKYLCSNNKIQTAIGYYNPYVLTLEFIFYGIKFILKLTSNEYANEIMLNKFDNYEIFILNDFNYSDMNEIIVSIKEEFILIINHVYKSGYYFGNSNVKMYKNDLMLDVTYDWYESPFNYEVINSANINGKWCINKSIEYKILDIDNAKSFIEIDIDEYDSDFKNFDELPNYTYFTIDDTLLSKRYYDIYDSSSYIYMNENNSIKIINGYDSSKYENANIDFRLKHGYILKSNYTPIDLLIALSYENKLNEYINSFNSNYEIYIIEGESNIIPEPIVINESYKPLSILTIRPNRIKFNNGLFNPNFIDIFNFELNDPISDEIDLDTLYANTRISYIDSIKNYYNNKILSNKSLYTYNYFVEDYRSPFSTNWDNNIYRSYTNDNTFSFLPGYSIGIEDKMFFGSKVLNLHNDGIILDKWNYLKNINTAKYNISRLNEHSKPKLVLEISLNLTKTFYKYCLNLNELIKNWSSIINFANTKIYINNYISNVLYNIYNFKGDFEITLYKLYSESLRETSPNVHFIQNNIEIDNSFEIAQNYKTTFKDINNEVILTITIDDYKNYKYYPIVKINKI